MRPPLYSGLVLSALAACGAQNPQTGKSPGTPSAAESLEISRELLQIAGQANQAAPAEVDPDTRLDGAKAGPGLTLTSRYTLVNAESQGINATTFEARKAAAIKSASCENPELRPLIDQGVAVMLEYRGNNGNLLGMITVNRDTCAAATR